MKATKNIEQRQDCRSEPAHNRKWGDLDHRYGEIGISAVAAAVRCRPENRAEKKTVRLVPEERE